MAGAKKRSGTTRKILGGKIVAMMPHEGTPAAEHVPPEWRKKIIHARLVVSDKLLMGSDAPPDRYEEPKGLLRYDRCRHRRRAERIFNALADNERSRCRCRRPSGPSASACWSISSASVDGGLRAGLPNSAGLHGLHCAMGDDVSAQ